jgi:hypothetical protein
MTPIVVTLPLRLVSEANRRGHWSKHSKRTRTQRGIARMALAGPMHLTRWHILMNGGGAIVTMTRIAPRSLDVGDNLNASMKGVRDGVADALGINDNDPRVEWRYAQRKGKVREYLCEIKVEAKP